MQSAQGALMPMSPHGRWCSPFLQAQTNAPCLTASALLCCRSLEASGLAQEQDQVLELALQAAAEGGCCAASLRNCVHAL